MTRRLVIIVILIAAMAAAALVVWRGGGAGRIESFFRSEGAPAPPAPTRGDLSPIVPPTDVHTPPREHVSRASW
jgi:hypothetical protein